MRAAGLALLAACAVFALAVAGLASALSLGMPGSSKPLGEARGVMLGMSREQVKESFVDASSGDWSEGTGCQGPSLEWTRRDPGDPTRWARFEFHAGWLVAMRVHTDGPAPAAHAEKSRSAVRMDRPYEGGTATTIIARGCETHAPEAEQIALSASR